VPLKQSHDVQDRLQRAVRQRFAMASPCVSGYVEIDEMFDSAERSRAQQTSQSPREGVGAAKLVLHEGTHGARGIFQEVPRLQPRGADVNNERA
jgi:hypothetical protein